MEKEILSTPPIRQRGGEIGRHIEEFLEFSWVWGFVVAFAKVKVVLVVLGCFGWAASPKPKACAGSRKPDFSYSLGCGWWAAQEQAQAFG